MTEDRLKKLRNCRKCNRLFSAAEGVSLCSRCNDEVDDEFTKVREYIYDNKSASVKDVSHNTGVETDIILKWIREGKIVLGDHSSISFCERCDAPSDGNRFCPKCVHELSVGLKSGLTEKAQPQRPKGGMHIKEKK